MPEYMDYNDYDGGEKTKRQKILSTISCILSAAFLIFIVIWTFTHLPENVRTNFEPVYSSAHKTDEPEKASRNAFLEFNSAYSEGEKVVVDKDFKSNAYRKIYELTQVSKLDLAKDKIDTFNIGNTFVVVRTYEVERQKDANGHYYDENKDTIIGTLGFDVLIFEFDTKDGFVINNPKRFSMRYHNKINDLVPTIEKVYVESESFRLNFYSLSIVVESENEFDKVYTNLNLSEGINKKEFENQFFVTSQFAKSKENKDLMNLIETKKGGERGDKFVSSAVSLSAPIKFAEIGINFDDAFYNKFSSFKVDAIENATYKIKVN